MADALIGFLGFRINAESTDFAGGWLITGPDGVPREFRHTHRVRPTVLQRLIYGDSMARHALLDLIGAPLASASAAKPELLLVRDRIALGMADRTTIPVALLHRARTPSSGTAGYDGPTILTPIPGDAQPEFELEVRESDRAKIPGMLATLDIAGRQISLFEPFGRIEAALQEAERRLAG